MYWKKDMNEKIQKKQNGRIKQNLCKEHENLGTN